MSERFTAARNVHDSKNTRLPIAAEFAGYRFGRDALAHVSRYLWICERLIERAKARGPLRVLDVGCGDIYVARTLQASFAVKKADVLAEYVGLDIDDRSLARTEDTKPKAFPIRLVCDDVTDGALDRLDPGYDVVICTEVVEHLQPRFVPDLLAGIRRLGEHAFISTPNWAGGSGRLPRDHVKEWTAAELHAAMTKAGIKVDLIVGTFCQLREVEAIAKTDEGVRSVFEYLRPRMDKHLLSLTMARLIGDRAQNLLWSCRL